MSESGTREGGSRAYRLKRGETVPSGIRRIADGRAAQALDHLGSGRDEDFAEAVHEARKDLKKLRSLLRLVRAEVGKDVYAIENARYRDAGRSLAGARDAEVRLATLAALEERFGDELPRREVGAFGRELQAERRDEAGGADIEAAVGLIEEGRARIPDWPLGKGDWDLIEPGLRRGYSRGRKAMKATREAPSPVNVHEWRKRVKDLWYHLRLVAEAWPEVLGPATEEAHRLSELLGNHHDLALLAERAERSPGFSGTGLDAFRSRIETAQADLLREADPIASRLYAERPKAFTKRLGRYWSSWRAR